LFGEFCPLRIFTGFPCPGCGMTRASLCLLKFRFREAFQWNPMVYVWIPALVFLFWKRYYVYKKSILQELVPIVVCLVTLVYYIYQMAECFPDREPYTYFPGNLLVMVRDAIAFFID
jgi:phosphatidylserine synthase